MFDHACCLPHSAKQNGLRDVAFLFRRGSGSLVARSRIVDMVIELCRFTSGLYVSLWRSRRRDEGTRRTESAARGGRFCVNVLSSVHACHAFLLRCFMFDHACCLPHSAKQNGLRNVAFLFRRGSRSPVARSRIVDMVIELCRFTSGLYVSLWRSRRRTKGTGDAERTRRTENGVDGAAWARFCAGALALICFYAGRTLGAARPQTCAKESLTPWTLFI